MGLERTLNYIRRYVISEKHKNRPDYIPLTNWYDIKSYSDVFREDNLLVFVGAKRESVAYNEGMESMPARLEKLFPANSILLIYPGTSRRTGRFEDYSDTDSRPLEKSIGKIGKWFRMKRRL